MRSILRGTGRRREAVRAAIRRVCRSGEALSFFVLALAGVATVRGQQGQIGPGVQNVPGSNGSSSQAEQNSPPQFRLPQMPAFLSGTVTYSGGAGPAANIAVQRVCGGSAHTVAYTNNKGQFSFQWGSPRGIVPDASDSGFGNDPHLADDRGANARAGLQGTGMLGCELVASAPGFWPARMDLSTRRSTDNPELGLMVLSRIPGVEGTSVSLTTLEAPKDAKKAWEKGVELLRSAKPADQDHAERLFRRAVDIYPKFANAWSDLGRALLRRRADDEARAAFAKALDADDKLVEPYIELGRMAALRLDWSEAAKRLDRALLLDPVDYPHLWLEDAIADYSVRNLDRAEHNVREALRTPPLNRDPRASRLLGLVLRDKQDYAGADEALRTYLRLAPGAGDSDQIKALLDQIDTHLALRQ